MFVAVPPVMYALAAWLLGFALAHNFPFSTKVVAFLLTSSLAVGFALFYFYLKHKTSVFYRPGFFLMIFSVVAISFLRTSQTTPPSGIPSLPSHSAVLATVKTIQKSEQEGKAHKAIAEQLYVSSDSIYRPIPGKALVYFKGDILQAGDQMYLPFVLKPIFPDSTTLQPWQAYYLRQHYFYRAYFDPDYGKIVSKGNFNWFQGLQSNLAQLVPTQISSQGLIKGLLLGDRSGLDPSTKEDLQKAGVIHVMAISGLHVGIIYLALLLLVQQQRADKANGWISVSILAVVWVFIFVSGVKPSAIRAGVMVSFFEMARLLQRKNHPWNSLAAAALVMLIYDPWLIRDVGFQLSFGAVAGILLVAPLTDYLYRPSTKVIAFFYAALPVSFAAQVGVTPFLVHHFGTFHPYFLLGNFLVLPLVAVIVPLGMTILLLSVVWNDSFLWEVVDLLAELATRAGNFVASLPFAQVEGLYLPWQGIFIYWALVIVVCRWNTIRLSLLARTQ